MKKSLDVWKRQGMSMQQFLLQDIALLFARVHHNFF